MRSADGIFEKLNSRQEAHDSSYLFDADTSRYLTVLVEGQVFPSVETAPEKLAELNTIEAILAAALQAEKDSVLFYDELAANAMFDEAKQVFVALKEEEKRHVVKLRMMFEAWD